MCVTFRRAAKGYRSQGRSSASIMISLPRRFSLRLREVHERPERVVVSVDVKRHCFLSFVMFLSKVGRFEIAEHVGDDIGEEPLGVVVLGLDCVRGDLWNSVLLQHQAALQTQLGV